MKGSNASRRAVVRLCAFLVVAIAALGGAAAADAGVVSVSVDSPTRGTLVYEAGAGEANHVTVELSSDLTTWTVTDTGAPLTAGAGCTAEAEHVSCAAPADGESLNHRVDMRLGDMDDHASGWNACSARQDGVPAYARCAVAIHGGQGNDTLVGHRDGDVYSSLWGDAGADHLSAEGSTVLSGGEGTDTLLSGYGDNTLDGGPGSDEIVGRGPYDLVTYADRVNRVIVSLDGQPNDGETGEGDRVVDVENVRTGSGPDVILGDARANHIVAGAGNDLVYAREGNDTVYGDAANTACAWNAGGAGGADRLYGGPGHDGLLGCGGNDVLAGLDGSDSLTGSGGADRLYGGNGSEDGDGGLVGGPGNDRIGGGPGRDDLEGKEGNDVLYSRDGYRDLVRGGAGYDRAQTDRGLDPRYSIERLF
jgi:Ca2+-binding RTX toxin-like protein